MGKGIDIDLAELTHPDDGDAAGEQAFLPFRAGGRVDLIGEVVHRPAYNLKRISWVNGVDVGITSRATFSLQYELEVDWIGRTGAAGNLTQVDLERLRFDEGTTTLHALRPSFALDYRDNSTHPERGWFASGSMTAMTRRFAYAGLLTRSAARPLSRK